MTDKQNTIFYKKKIIPENIFIHTEEYFLLKKMSDLLQAVCLMCC